MRCVLPLVSHRNPFETAQLQTVLIVRPDGGQGSGVIFKRVNRDGNTRLFVWTAAHVVKGVDRVDVVRYVRNEGDKVGELRFKALIVDRSDSLNDVALLWLNAPASQFEAAEFEFDSPRVGDVLFHVGNFFGGDFDGSVSRGVLSQIGVHPHLGWLWNVTDQYAGAAVPGSSGGPVFDLRGRVVGLIVGGAGAGQWGFVSFVPVRVISAFARGSGISWAVRGGYCPNDDTLKQRVINSSDAQKLIQVEPEPGDDH